MPDDPGWRQSRWRRAQAAAIATIGVPLVEAIGATYHWRETGADGAESEKRGSAGDETDFDAIAGEPARRDAAQRPHPVHAALPAQSAG